MKIFNKYTISVGALVLALGLTACMIPEERDDPFEKLTDEKTETLKGDIYPFSVSVATSATHRLEKEGRLVAYLTSNIVDIKEFENRSVEVDGVWRKEKMREIFLVEAIRLQDLEEEPEEEPDKRFTSKKFTFIYPPNWEKSTSPNGIAHFTDKADTVRRVFLMFSVEDIEDEDDKKDKNILIGGISGFKKSTTDNMDRERQEIELFSNSYDLKYRFIFTSSFEEFERKKAFFRLLNSFTEGEENVKVVIEKEKRKLAEEEAKKLKKEEVKKAKEDALIASEEAKEEDKESILDKIFGDKKVAEESSEEVEKEVLVDDVIEEKKVQKIDLTLDYKNLVDEKAFLYESAYLNLKIQVPWGYWFRNFGTSANALTRIGFANHKINSSADIQCWLEILGDENPPSQFSETAEDGNLVVIMPRNNKSFYKLSGPVEFRDAIRSIADTIGTVE